LLVDDLQKLKAYKESPLKPSAKDFLDLVHNHSPGFCILICFYAQCTMQGLSNTEQQEWLRFQKNHNASEFPENVSLQALRSQRAVPDVVCMHNRLLAASWLTDPTNSAKKQWCFRSPRKSVSL
jgi:hypothetical protein